MSCPRDLARILKILSVETRIRILHLLKGRALCVGALSAQLDVTQGAVSQHLRILRDAGILIADKRGYYVHYHVNEKTLAKWKEQVGNFLSTIEDSERACRSRKKKKGAKLCATRKKAAKSLKS